MLPFAFTALMGYWYYRRRGLAKGFAFALRFFSLDLNEPNLAPSVCLGIQGLPMIATVGLSRRWLRYHGSFSAWLASHGTTCRPLSIPFPWVFGHGEAIETCPSMKMHKSFDSKTRKSREMWLKNRCYYVFWELCDFCFLYNVLSSLVMIRIWKVVSLFAGFLPFIYRCWRKEFKEMKIFRPLLRPQAAIYPRI